MPDAIILVENVSKRYTIGHRRDPQDGLRHAVEDVIRSPLRWLRAHLRKKRANAEQEEFWALKNVSFEVATGDVIGIIGRNGAGKSTLLKILSRITEPTTGRITLKGRVASLLEVGTGFHQELTGRENIFLNGAILGMSKSEIKRKFDEIVDFSEIEKFLDTPVKRYSSGMYVRLAFAVAAHLEPEILIVDEVLAVGDASFQKKCLGKMGEVAKGGRTVLFVSHNVAAVQALCTKALYLQKGTVKATGAVDLLLPQYLSDTGSGGDHVFRSPRQLGPSLKLMNFDFTPVTVQSGARMDFRLVFEAAKTVTFTDLALLINTAQGTRVALVDLRSLGLPLTIPARVLWSVQGTFKSVPFVEGEYSVGITVNIGHFHENVFDLAGFGVSARNIGEGYAPYPVIYRGSVELDFVASSTLDKSSTNALKVAESRG